MIRSPARSWFARHVVALSFNRLTMNVMILFLIWCCLAALAWPFALLVLVLLPLLWLIALPFRLLGMVVSAAFIFIRTVLLLPSRLLGYRPL